jgi:hypothetical protein
MINQVLSPITSSALANLLLVHWRALGGQDPTTQQQTRNNQQATTIVVPSFSA